MREPPMRQATWRIVAVSGIWLSLPADAQPADTNDASCKNSNPNLAISSCTSVIQSGSLAGDILAAAYNDRGDAYTNKYDDEHAIADYNQALKLRPNYVQALVSRGLAYANQQNFELAITDYSHAIRIDPTNAKAFYGRGLAKFGLCDIDGAEQDLAKARELDPKVGK
jgi:tetratricopeptide (TPR) repeat protein